MSTIDKITQEMEAEVKRSKGGNVNNVRNRPSTNIRLKVCKKLSLAGGVVSGV